MALVVFEDEEEEYSDEPSRSGRVFRRIYSVEACKIDCFAFGTCSALFPSMTPNPTQFPGAKPDRAQKEPVSANSQELATLVVRLPR